MLIEMLATIAYIVCGCSLLMVVVVMLLDRQTRQHMEAIHRQEKELHEARLREAQAQSAVRIYMQRCHDMQDEILQAKKTLESRKIRFSERDKATCDLYQRILHYQSYSDCRELIDKRLNHFFEKLETDYPEFSEAQQQLLLFFLLGIKADDIALLMNFQESSVANTKSRLAHKLGLTSTTLLRPKLEEILCKEIEITKN